MTDVATIDLTQELPNDLRSIAKAWVGEEDGVNVALDVDAFSYDSWNYETALDGILSAAFGHAADGALFVFPRNTLGYMDLLADGEGAISGIRYILAPDGTAAGKLHGVNLASEWIDLKSSTEDRSASGADAVAAVLVVAALELRRLAKAYQALTES